MFVGTQVNPDSGDDWSAFCDVLHERTSPQIFARNDFLFTAGAISIIAGLLVPLSTHVFDVLLVFSLSLTAAVMAISFSARSATDASGFALLVMLVTMLRMGLNIGCSKLIISEGQAGSIVGFIGNIIAGKNVTIAIFGFGMLMLVSFLIVCRSVKTIGRSAKEFITNIAPAEKISINSDLDKGIISRQKADSLKEKITREIRFFAGMNSVGSFILCALIIELVVASVNIAGAIAGGFSAGTPVGLSSKACAVLGIGVGVITQISAILAACSCEYLVRKSSVQAIEEDRVCEKEFNERIRKVAAKVTDTNQEMIELDLGDGEIEYQDDAMTITRDLQWLDENKCDEGQDETGSCALWKWQEIKDGDYYDTIAGLIESKSESVEDAKTTLLAAENFDELPVTVPVTIAMRLAQKNKKCLIIDLDRQRDAVSKVFEIDSKQNTNGGEIVTSINNIWVRPAKRFAGDYGAELKKVIENGHSRYDCIIVYAPNVSAGSVEIAGCIEKAILFGSEKKVGNSPISDLHKALADSNCEVLSDNADVLVASIA